MMVVTKEALGVTKEEVGEVTSEGVVVTRVRVEAPGVVGDVVGEEGAKEGVAVEDTETYNAHYRTVNNYCWKCYIPN